MSFWASMNWEWGELKKDLFGRPVLLDNSPTYLRVPYVPCRIRLLWPGAKIIVLVRSFGSGDGTSLSKNYANSLLTRR